MRIDHEDGGGEQIAQQVLPSLARGLVNSVSVRDTHSLQPVVSLVERVDTIGSRQDDRLQRRVGEVPWQDSVACSNLIGHVSHDVFVPSRVQTNPHPDS